MESLFRAQREMRQLNQDEAALESELVLLLEEKARAATSNFPESSLRRMAEIEEEISEIHTKKNEFQILIDYYEAKGSCPVTADDLLFLAYTARRADVGRMTVHGANAALQEQSIRWSETNSTNRITSVLLVTPTIFFGVLEGPSNAIEQTFAKVRLDARAENVSVICRRHTESRDFNFGLKFHVVEDDLIAMIIDEMKLRGDGAKKYCPANIVALAMRGGDPSGIAADTAERIIISVMLDSLCGAVHHAPRYINAQGIIDEAVAKNQGLIVERFGEVATAIFALSGAKPVTQVVAIARRIHEEVPYSVVGVHIGNVSSVLLPHCTAVGQGLRETQRLVFLAEHHRRPLVISPPAIERCNLAEHKLTQITIENVVYYTLTDVGETRLPPPPEKFKMMEYNPRDDVVPPDPSKPHIIRDPTASELCQLNILDAKVAGAINQFEIQQVFRTLDITDCGWISKNKFREFVASYPNLKLFPDDVSKRVVTKLEREMERLNRLGDERLSFAEFGLLYLMLVKT